MVNYDFRKGERLSRVVFVFAAAAPRQVMFHFQGKSRSHPPCTFNPTLHPVTGKELHKEIAVVRLTLFYMDDDENLDLDGGTCF